MFKACTGRQVTSLAPEKRGSWLGVFSCSQLLSKDSRALELVYRGHRWKLGRATSAVISAQPLFCLDLRCPVLQLPAAVTQKRRLICIRVSWPRDTPDLKDLAREKCELSQ